jgi:hypothetical protein
MDEILVDEILILQRLGVWNDVCAIVGLQPILAIIRLGLVEGQINALVAVRSILVRNDVRDLKYSLASSRVDVPNPL